MDKFLVSGVAAAGTGVLAEFAERRRLFGTTLSGGFLTSAGLITLAYLMYPTARGNMVPAMGGAVDGAAAWLGIKFLTPALGLGYRPRAAFVSSPMAPVFGGIEI